MWVTYCWCFLSTGGVSFIDVPSVSSGSSENTSSAVSPATDSGLEISSQISSREDLTDLPLGSPLGISATVPLTESRAQEQPEPQVLLYCTIQKTHKPDIGFLCIKLCLCFLKCSSANHGIPYVAPFLFCINDGARSTK